MAVNRVICVSSDASLDLYYNTHHHFANVLPYRLNPPPGSPTGKLYLQVLGIWVGRVLIPNDNGAVGSLKIHIREIEEQIQDRHFSQVAASVAWDSEQVEKMRGGTYRLCPVNNAPRIPLKGGDLRTLNVRLSNEYSGPITIDPDCPPTHLFVRITDMGPEKGEFTITCTSNHPDFFPRNTINSFSAPLQRDIRLPNYEIALLSIVKPANLEEEDRYASLQVDGAGPIMHFNLSQMQTLDEFVSAVSDALQANPQTADRLIFHSQNGRLHLTHRRREEAGEGEVPRPPFLVTLLNYFSRVCGEDYKPVHRLSIGEGQRYTFDGRPNLFNILPSPAVFVECDLVETNVLSGRAAQILASVPFDVDSPLQDRLYQPRQLTFHPAVRAPFNRIKFALRDANGELRQFKSADDIMITLVFRLRQNRRR